MCISAVLGLGSAIVGAGSASRAADAQERAARDQVDLQREIYDSQTELFSPYRESGQNALAVQNYLLGLGELPTIGGAADGTGGFEYGGFQESPGYQFALQQGQDAIQSSAAAQGGLYSGRTMQDLQTHGQGMANQEFNNYLAQISGAAGQGQAATAQTAQAGQNFATGAGNALAGIGNAQAAGAIGVGNAIQGGISNGLGLWQYQQGLNNSGSGSGGGSWWQA